MALLIHFNRDEISNDARYDRFDQICYHTNRRF